MGEVIHLCNRRRFEKQFSDIFGDEVKQCPACDMHMAVLEDTDEYQIGMDLFACRHCGKKTRREDFDDDPSAA